MSATAHHRAPSPAATPGTPDPDAFAATVTPVAPGTWPASAVGDAADTGVLVAGRDRLLAGLGVAATLPLPHGLADLDALRAARSWLRALPLAGGALGDRPWAADDDGNMDRGGSADARVPAPAPVALGAFPFDRGGPAALVVPSVTWCKDAAGRAWRVDVGSRATALRSAPLDVARGNDGAPDRPDDPEVLMPEIVQVPQPAGYADAVARAVADIRAGKLRKVVLGRLVELMLVAPPRPSTLLETLWGAEGPFSPFSVPTLDGRLVGASPELVVGRRGRSVISHAFAGTVPLSNAGADDEVQWLIDSAKDRSEHRLVVDEIATALVPRCVTLSVPTDPTVLRLRSDARLGSLITGTLAEPSSRDTVLALLALLHPTPAVGGVPRAEALARIAALESSPRGYWAGVVGWVDGAGDGEWVLGIRSVELSGRRARVRAGAGIVADSDPERELSETTVKLRPVLDALWPGASSLL